MRGYRFSLNLTNHLLCKRWKGKYLKLEKFVKRGMWNFSFRAHNLSYLTDIFLYRVLSSFPLISQSHNVLIVRLSYSYFSFPGPPFLIISSSSSNFLAALWVVFPLALSSPCNRRLCFVHKSISYTLCMSSTFSAISYCVSL